MNNKWNQIIENNEIEEEEINSFLEYLTKQKNFIDNIFNQIEEENEENKERKEEEERRRNLYSKSLDLYLNLINEIKQQNNSLNFQLNSILIILQLNCLCCYLKLQEYHECLLLCDDLIDTKPCYLTNHQQIRCYYFKSFSFYKLYKNSKDLQNALEFSKKIQNILQQTQLEINESERNEYSLLSQMITSQLYNTNIGLNFLSQEQFSEAYQWFNEAILSFSNSENTKDFNRLSTYFEGLGNSFIGLNNYSKVSFYLSFDSSSSCSCCYYFFH